MNTTDELFETTEELADASVVAEETVIPESEEEMDIPENYLAGVSDKDFVANDSANDSADDSDMFVMDYSDIEKEDAKEAEKAERKILKKMLYLVLFKY